MGNGERASFRAPLRTKYISNFGVGKLVNISEGGLLLSEVEFDENYITVMFSLPRYPIFSKLTDHLIRFIKSEDIHFDIIKVDVAKAWRSGDKCGVSYLSLDSKDEQLILNYCAKISKNLPYVLNLFESEENSERLFKCINLLGHNIDDMSLDGLRSRLLHDYTHMS